MPYARPRRDQQRGRRWFYAVGDNAKRGNKDLADALMNRARCGRVVPVLYNNLGYLMRGLGDLRRDAELREKSLRMGARFGDESVMRFARGTLVSWAYLLGRWDECQERADAFVAECESGPAHYLEADVRQWRALIRYQRGDLDGAASDSELALARGREVGDPQVLHHVLASSIRIGVELERFDTLGPLVDELLPAIDGHGRIDVLIELCWVAEPLNLTALLQAEFACPGRPDRPWHAIAGRLLEGAFGDAAEAFAGMEAATWEAEARLRAGLRLREAGRSAEAEVQLGRAREFFNAVGATRRLGAIDGANA